MIERGEKENKEELSFIFFVIILRALVVNQPYRRSNL